MLGLNIKIPVKQLSSHILDVDSGPINVEHEQTLTYVWESRDWLLLPWRRIPLGTMRLFIYLKEDTYWLRMEMVGSMMSFLTFVFSVIFCCCHRKFIYAALMTTEKIPHVYKTDASHLCIIWEPHVFILLPLVPHSKGGDTAKTLLIISTLIVVIFTSLGIFICI